jgi:hypothetical protein
VGEFKRAMLSRGSNVFTTVNFHFFKVNKIRIGKSDFFFNLVGRIKKLFMIVKNVSFLKLNEKFMFSIQLDVF